MRAQRMKRGARLGALLLLCAGASVVALHYAGAAAWWRGGERSAPCATPPPSPRRPAAPTPPPHAIFFHETSPGAASLTPRQACAVESAALTNPGSEVRVLFLGPLEEGGRRGRTLAALLRYGNVRLARLRLERYAAGSPLEGWLASGALNRSRYRVSHTSDVLRYLTLWRGGGVYLDLDVVVARPLRELTANWAGRESGSAVAAGALSFSRDADGRRFADAAVRELRASFRGDDWGYNGPGVITRVLQRHCDTRHVALMTAERCGGFEVYCEQYFYPIHWRDWKQYFEPDMLAKVKAMNSTYIFHVWNKLSHGQATSRGVEVPYTYLARRYCPAVYNLTGDHF